jgi:hypothetical protein
MSLPDAIAAPRVSQRNTATPVAEANFYNSPLAQQLTTQYGEKFTLQTGPVLLMPSGSAVPSASNSYPAASCRPLPYRCDSAAAARSCQPALARDKRADCHGDEPYTRVLLIDSSRRDTGIG